MKTKQKLKGNERIEKENPQKDDKKKMHTFSISKSKYFYFKFFYIYLFS